MYYIAERTVKCFHLSATSLHLYIFMKATHIPHGNNDYEKLNASVKLGQREMDNAAAARHLYVAL